MRQSIHSWMCSFSQARNFTGKLSKMSSGEIGRVLGERAGLALRMVVGWPFHTKSYGFIGLN